MSSMTRLSRSWPAIASALLLAGCSDGGTVTTLDAAPSVSVELPDFLGNTDGPVESMIRPTIQLSNGANVSINRVSFRSWTGTIDVEVGRSYTATITWVEIFEGSDLPLAELTQELQVADDGSVTSSITSEYSTELDFDSDGVSNLQERQNGTDPRSSDNDSDSDNDAGTPEEEPDSPSSPVEPTPDPDPAPTPDPVTPPDPAPSPDPDPDPEPEPEPEPLPEPEPPVVVTADVVIPRIAKEAAPDIDGAGVTINAMGALTGEWADAIQSDDSGAPLLIDNLMIDIDAEAPDGTAYRRWAAMHDGTYLYVVVLVDDNGDRNRDSGTQLFADDSLELYLDGDNSKSRSYDENDFHRIFPMQLAGRDKQSTTSGDMAGVNSSRAALGIKFATGPGIGPDGLRRANFEQDVYELRIDIASAGIDLDAPLGFELQVNDDDEGGNRNSKWGWKHPSRNGSDVDGTIENPSLMGTVLLE